jgi:acyl-CoA:acyl-CoA alkyltransferase
MARFTKSHIAAIGFETAPEIVTSDDIEALLEPLYRRLHIAPGQLAALTGIHRRRWWPEGYPVSQGALAASIDAIRKAGIRSRDIDVVIYAGVCRDDFEPATACHVAAGIPGLNPRALVYDVSNACLGVINGIMQVSGMIELGQARCGLVTSCETARDITMIMIRKLLDTGSMDFFRYGLATLTGGSGAAAVLVTSADLAPGHRCRIRGGVQRTAPRHHMLCRWSLEPVQADYDVRPFMHTDSVGVLKHGVALAASTWQDFLAEMEWERGDIDRVICHQVGSAHQKTVLDTFGIDPSIDFPTYPDYGNIGTVSLPFTAAMAEDAGALQSGDNVGFLGIGSGLNCMMLGIEW